MTDVAVTDVRVVHVEPGETLSGIAARHDVSVEELLRWNRIEDPDLVLVGQRIFVHAAGDAESLVPGRAPEAAPGPGTATAPPGPDAADPDTAGSVPFGMIAVAVAVAVVLVFLLRSGARRRGPATRVSPAPPPARDRPDVRSTPRTSRASPPAQGRVEVHPSTRISRAPPSVHDFREVLVGKAWVIDGDGIRVSGQVVRFAGLDAPEYDQVAKHRDGYWFGHGRRVKRALIRKIGGQQVCVQVEAWDKFGRAVGIVTCDGRDVGEWLVREGHAIAAYGDRYKSVERQARRDGRGMWSHAVNIDPRRWRHQRS